MIPLFLIFILLALFAAANGANDVSKGVATLAGSGVTRYRRAILWGAVTVSLIAKVRAALPEILREHLDALAQVYGSSSVPAKDFAPHAPTIERLTAAAMSHTRVRMTYHSLTSDKLTVRGFDPYAVCFDPDGATLKTIGADTDTKRITTFAIDRIRKIEEEVSRDARHGCGSNQHCLHARGGEPRQKSEKRLEKSASPRAPGLLQLRCPYQRQEDEVGERRDAVGRRTMDQRA